MIDTITRQGQTFTARNERAIGIGVPADLIEAGDMIGLDMFGTFGRVTGIEHRGTGVAATISFTTDKGSRMAIQQGAEGRWQTIHISRKA